LAKFFIAVIGDPHPGAAVFPYKDRIRHVQTCLFRFATMVCDGEERVFFVRRMDFSFSTVASTL
jgi:hypothetical protein